MKSNFYIEKKHGSDYYQIIQYITDPVLKPKVKSYTGERIHFKQWNKNAQRGKGSLCSDLNNFLDSLVTKADNVRLKLKSEGRFTREDFLREFTPETRAKAGLYDYFDEWLLYCETEESEITDRDLTGRTIQMYRVAKSVLQDYEKTRGITLNIRSFDREWYKDFKKYVLAERSNDKKPGEKIKANTHSGYIKNLKKFLRWMSEKEKSVSVDFLKFKARFTKSEDKPLKEEELQWLYDQDVYKLSIIKKVIASVKKDEKHKGTHKANIRSKLESLERARLVFLLLCCTGKRISDYKKMEKTEIEGEIIKFMTQKTKLVCYVPYFDDIYFRPKYIIEEMNSKFGGLPKVSDQKLREAIAELSKVIGLTRFIPNTKTGRKTFATIKLLKGVPKAIIMKSTGHKSEKSFDSYVEIDQFDVLKGNKEKATYLMANAS
jgi:hypothetical protein